MHAVQYNTGEAQDGWWISLELLFTVTLLSTLLFSLVYIRMDDMKGEAGQCRYRTIDKIR